MALDVETEFRSAVQDLRKGAESLQHLRPLLAALEEMLKGMLSPGGREAQTTPAQRITEQPVHSGQIPPKKVSEFGDHGRL